MMLLQHMEDNTLSLMVHPSSCTGLFSEPIELRNFTWRIMVDGGCQWWVLMTNSRCQLFGSICPLQHSMYN